MRHILLVLLLIATRPCLAGDGFRDEVLAAHNTERAAIGLPLLRWDTLLAAHAQSWAQHITALGHLEHAISTGEGENLWMGDSNGPSVTAMVDDWIGEKVDFQYGTFPSVSRSGHWHDVGHYTQVVWRRTSKLGCGLTANDGWNYLVCRYWPGGNVIGEKPF